MDRTVGIVTPAGEEMACAEHLASTELPHVGPRPEHDSADGNVGDKFGDAGFRLVHITDPANPSEVGRYIDPNGNNSGRGLGRRPELRPARARQRPGLRPVHLPLHRRTPKADELQKATGPAGPPAPSFRLRQRGAGLHHPVAIRIRDEHTINEARMDVSGVRREDPDEIEPILCAVHHQHVAVRASAEPGVVSASRVLPLAGLVRFRRSRRRQSEGRQHHHRHDHERSLHRVPLLAIDLPGTTCRTHARIHLR
jgi:hypothetical protein